MSIMGSTLSRNRSPGRAETARFGAGGFLDAPLWVTLAVGAGLAALGACAFGCVWTLEKAAVRESTEERGRAFEAQLDGIIRRLAAEEFSREDGSLEALGARLVAALEDEPAVRDLVVLDMDRRVVRSFERTPERVPCAVGAPLDKAREHEHAAGKLGPEPVGCKSLPLVAGGRTRGLVFYHTERDWHAEGARMGVWFRRTAFRLTAVFAVFYALLGAMLVWASRTIRRYRLRAASAERVEALGALADGINHEIKNPLNAVGLSLQYLGRRHSDPATKEVVETAQREADRIRERLEEFGRYARVSRLDAEDVDLAKRVAKRFDDLDVTGRARGRVDASKMESAFEAIVCFLRQQGGDGDRRQVAFAQGRGHWGFLAECCARSLSDKDLERLFDAYRRTGPHDVSCGLGLARAVFQAHGGQLAAHRRGERLVLTGRVPTAPPELTR